MQDEEERQPIQEIVDVTFPHLLNIFQVRYGSARPCEDLALIAYVGFESAGTVVCRRESIGQ
jgi:hypothetical protein